MWTTSRGRSYALRGLAYLLQGLLSALPACWSFPMIPRAARKREAFELQCVHCDAVVELPAHVGRPEGVRGDRRGRRYRTLHPPAGDVKARRSEPPRPGRIDRGETAERAHGQDPAYVSAFLPGVRRDGPGGRLR